MQIAKWNTIPFYVVGEASASAARALRLNTGIPPRLAPDDVLGGAEANTAEELAHFIRKHVEGASSGRASSNTLFTAQGAGAAQAASGATSEPQPVAGTVFDDYDTLSTLAGSTHEGAASAHASTDNLLAPPTQSPTSSTFDPNTAPPPAAGTSSSSILPIQAHSPSVRSVPGRVRPRGATLQHIPTKLLFLVGDKTRDVLPRVLAEGNKAHPAAVPIEVDAVQVYATRPSKGLEEALARAVKAQSGGACHFFSVLELETDHNISVSTYSENVVDRALRTLRRRRRAPFPATTFHAPGHQRCLLYLFIIRPVATKA